MHVSNNPLIFNSLFVVSLKLDFEIMILFSNNLFFNCSIELVVSYEISLSRNLFITLQFSCYSR